MNAVTAPYDDRQDAVVIGSGVGGLTCGAFLAKNGMAVKVFEKHSVPGGYCTFFARKGFRFSATVEYITGCGTEGETTKLLSELDLTERIEFCKIEPLCNLLLPGGAFIIPAGFNDWVDMLAEHFHSEAAGIISFFDAVRIIVESINTSHPSPIVAEYQDKTLQEMMDKYLVEPQLKAIISGIFYGGLPPSRFSALSWCIAMKGRLSDGAYLPIGGPQMLTDALVDALRHFGGQLELNAGVTRVLTEEGRAVGVQTTDGRRIKADFVVSNAAAWQVFGGLVSHREMAAVAPDFINKLRDLEICTSAMIVYLGVDLDIEHLGVTDFLTIVHESLDFEREWEAASQGILADAFYSVSIPTLLDPSLAPPDKHIVHIFTYAPYSLPGRDWSEEVKNNLTDIMIEKAERVLPGLSSHILVQESATPRTLERYTMNTQAATAGWARSPKNLISTLMPRTPIERLYLTGNWTRYGGSVKSVALSGRTAAQMIMSDQ